MLWNYIVIVSQAVEWQFLTEAEHKSTYYQSVTASLPEMADGMEAALTHDMQEAIAGLTLNRCGPTATVLSSQSSALASRIVIRRCRDEVGSVRPMPFVIAASLEVL
jgi:hypothetical protein